MSASTQSDVREGIGRHLRRLPPGHIQHRSGPDGNRQPPLGGFAAAFVLPLDTVTAIHLGRARKEFFFLSSLLFLPVWYSLADWSSHRHNVYLTSSFIPLNNL